MRTVIPVAIALAACTPVAEQTVVPIQTQETVTVATGDGSADIRITRENFIARAELSGARADIFRVLPEVLREIGLPAPALDRTRWTGAIQNQTVSGPLARQRLSHYLDCGRNITGENADSRRVRLNLHVALEAAGADRTVVFTRVEATAHSIEGASTAALPCSSRGQLEILIARGLQLRAAGG